MGACLSCCDDGKSQGDPSETTRLLGDPVSNISAPTSYQDSYGSHLAGGGDELNATGRIVQQAMAAGHRFHIRENKLIVCKRGKWHSYMEISGLNKLHLETESGCLKIVQNECEEYILAINVINVIDVTQPLLSGSAADHQDRERDYAARLQHWPLAKGRSHHNHHHHNGGLAGTHGFRAVQPRCLLSDVPAFETLARPPISSERNKKLNEICEEVNEGAKSISVLETEPVLVEFGPSSIKA